MRGRKLKAAKLKALPTSTDDWTILAEQVEQQIANGTFKFSGIYSTEVAGKKVISTTDVSDAIVLRKINDNIRRAYGIRQAQRAESIRLLKDALAEWTPKSVVTLDLKSCFETITPALVLAKLRREGRVSSQTISLLQTFFHQTRRFGANQGLPRGILISSTLAELYLKDLDAAVSLISGVYVYIRYVDDIVALAARDEDDISRLIEVEVTNLGLKVNKAKGEKKRGGCKCSFTCTHKPKKCPCAKKCECECTVDNFEEIDYLGYKIIFPTGYRTKIEKRSYVILSKRKAHKTKFRIAQSVSSFKIDRDYDLLRDRLRYLTRNVITDRTIAGSRLLSGIAFTFSEYEEPPRPHRFEKYTLQGLDTFVSMKLSILRRQGLVSQIQADQLLLNTFKAGFSRRHRLSLPSHRIKAIRMCWNVR
jgi:hypothetical protein